MSNPMKPGTVQLGSATIHIGYAGIVPPNMRGFARELTEFYVPEEHRNKGEGSELLKEVCDQADQHRILLIIMADNDRLADFYARFGFQQIQISPILMIRPPMIEIELGKETMH